MNSPTLSTLLSRFHLYQILQSGKSGTDGRPIICKHASVTGRHFGPILVIRVDGRFLIRMVHLVHGRIIGHLEHGMSIAEICHEYGLTPEQVQAVKQLSPEQVQYVKGYADALENVVLR